jgi:hypothetical protein
VEAASTISSGANITAPLAMSTNIEKCVILRALKQTKVEMRVAALYQLGPAR